ncbi:MAG: fumarylacetoacetate hydrolase family protein [Isosphaeraceae bacterium]
MRLARFSTHNRPEPAVGLLQEDRLIALEGPLSRFLHAADPLGEVERAPQGPAYRLDQVRLLAPIEAQEVWGAGVTYERSKTAREQESEQAATFYDQVYQADRPELFFKATPGRVVGPDEAVRVRSDTGWSVPEPELALVLSPDLRLVGFTIGNDMSARDIEGRNPLYLPQAKVYDRCCALGPAIALNGPGIPLAFAIELRIERDGSVLFSGTTSTERMARSFDELIGWLGRDNIFPNGVILLTGTGIVPPDDLSLEAGDRVAITINSIGTLNNPVIRGSASVG